LISGLSKVTWVAPAFSASSTLNSAAYV